MIDKPLTIRMILLGLTTDQIDKARLITIDDINPQLRIQLGCIVSPNHLLQYANGERDMPDGTFEMFLKETRSEARVIHR